MKLLRRGSPFQARSSRLLEGATSLRGRGSRGETVEIVAEFRARDAKKWLEALFTLTEGSPAMWTSTPPSPAWNTHRYG